MQPILEPSSRASCRLLFHSFSEEITARFKAALDEIGKSHYEVLRVGFGNFTYEYSSLAGSFSRFLEEQLKGAIEQSH